jgi:hypothetical protein
MAAKPRVNALQNQVVIRFVADAGWTQSDRATAVVAHDQYVPLAANSRESSFDPSARDRLGSGISRIYRDLTEILAAFAVARKRIFEHWAATSIPRPYTRTCRDPNLTVLAAPKNSSEALSDQSKSRSDPRNMAALF